MLEKQLTPLFYALLSLKWLQKTLDVYREKAEEQLQEMVNSVKSICLGPTAWVIDGIFKCRATNPNVLKQLSHKDFLTTLDVLCEQFLRAATRSRRVIAICNNILATVPTRGEENFSSICRPCTHTRGTRCSSRWERCWRRAPSCTRSCLFRTCARCGTIAWTS